jgi:hypothetical protein
VGLELGSRSCELSCCESDSSRVRLAGLWRLSVVFSTSFFDIATSSSKMRAAVLVIGLIRITGLEKKEMTDSISFTSEAT